jgi:putative hydrolase of the HAD superfamily
MDGSAGRDDRGDPRVFAVTRGVAVLWDFDGTLATRSGAWAGCLIEVLDELEPGHAVSIDKLRPFLRAGFPWHDPTAPHPHLSTPDAWWEHLTRLLARAYEGAGIGAPRAAELAKCFRSRYVDHRYGWRLFDDTLPALARSRDLGWRNVILSNHVPELSSIAGGLGLSAVIDGVVSSAVTGYEKPHPEAFRLGKAAASPASGVWMVGDNYEVDVLGAEAVGIPAILARTEHEGSLRHAATLDRAIALIEREVAA